MKSTLALGFLALASLATVPALSLAGQADTHEKSDKVRTLSGCLSAGEKSGEQPAAQQRVSQERPRRWPAGDARSHRLNPAGKVFFVLRIL